MTTATPTHDAGDWIAHDQDRCPVERGALVQVRYRDGGSRVVRALEHTNACRDGDARFWVTSDHHHSDIIAYRIVDPQP